MEALAMNRATTMRRLGADVPMMKERLSTAFAAMRKRDILARQKLLCCQTCGLSQIQSMLEQRATRKDPKRRKIYDGYAFYHAQDAEALDRMFEWYKPARSSRAPSTHASSRRKRTST